MKNREADILIVRGLGGGSPDHWYARWEDKLATTRTVQQTNWHAPDLMSWTERLVAETATAQKPVVLIGHSLGVATIVQAAHKLKAFDVRAAFLVAVPDIDLASEALPEIAGFGPLSRDPLPFPSVLVASRTDPHCAYETADDLGAAWGSLVVDAGDSGHLNPESGHGPWPEGLMVFSRMMSRL
ncbi:MAG: alpha/beta fold hydrolase [Pseudomonadota bacterium]